MTPSVALAALELLAHGLREPDAHRRDRVSRARPRARCGAAGLATATSAIRIASRAVEVRACRGGGSGGRRGRRRRRRAGRGRPRRTTASGSTSPAMPRPPSTSWQKPCVVAIVAASKSASARTSRSWRSCDLVRRPVGEQRHDLVGAGRRAGQRALEPCSADDQPLAHALAQLAGRHARERHEQQLRPAACPRRRSAPRARRSCTSCRCPRSPRARSRRSAAGRRRRTAATADLEVAHTRRVTAPRSTQQAGPQPPREAAEARRLGVVPAVARLVRCGPAARAERRTPAMPPKTSWCSGSRPRFGNPSPTPTRARGVRRRRPRDRARRRRRRSVMAGERQRLAHARGPRGRRTVR